MLVAQLKSKGYEEYQDELGYKKKLPLGKNVKKALKDYLRDYKGHGDRPLFPAPKVGKQTIKE
ncbi:hypothetical protein [Calidifontibacillus oryziterrae]|uniref:hypothetical protein n=1 Tax=Calidifontibacillus oryziterrae TaxID=1191699 RepID=UPI0002F9835D|nr:hypothetical protein [Calidifontibacillus oryziterrae]